MTCIVIHCKTCKQYMAHDTFSHIDALLKSVNEVHKGHVIEYGFSNKIPQRFRSRQFTRYLGWNYRYPLVGCEIGVRYGDNAYNILNLLNMKRLYLIDPYTKYKGYDDTEWDGKSIEDEFKKAKELLKPFKNKITFVKEYAHKAIDMIPDNLDFVYIDGNHAYDYVMKDLELYYPKVKINGLIGGHDFSLDNPDVPRAACDFIHKYGLKDVTSEYNDFWIIKKKELCHQH